MNFIKLDLDLRRASIPVKFGTGVYANIPKIWLATTQNLQLQSGHPADTKSEHFFANGIKRFEKTKTKTLIT